MSDNPVRIPECTLVPTVWGQRCASCITQSCVPDRLLTIPSTQNELCRIIQHAKQGRVHSRGHRVRSGRSMALKPRATETRLGNIPLKGQAVRKYSQDPTLFLHVGTTVEWVIIIMMIMDHEMMSRMMTMLPQCWWRRADLMLKLRFSIDGWVKKYYFL